MIRNVEYFDNWEREFLAKESLTLQQKLRIYDGMYEEARLLGVFPLKDPLEGLQEKINWIKAINVRKAP